MNPSDLYDIFRERIPTPAEFVAFIALQGWRIAVRGDGAAVLLVRNGKEDPLAVSLARLLSREPYRSEVMALVRRAEGDTVVAPPDNRPFLDSEESDDDYFRRLRQFWGAAWDSDARDPGAYRAVVERYTRELGFCHADQQG